MALGASTDIFGRAFEAGESLFPCLTVLPMGWSWSFWIVQQIHEQLIAKEGFDYAKRVVAQWPSPSLVESDIAAPYCDSLTIIGFEKDSVDSHLSRLI